VRQSRLKELKRLHDEEILHIYRLVNYLLILLSFVPVSFCYTLSSLLDDLKAINLESQLNSYITIKIGNGKKLSDRVGRDAMCASLHLYGITWALTTT